MDIIIIQGWEDPPENDNAENSRHIDFPACI